MIESLKSSNCCTVSTHQHGECDSSCVMDLKGMSEDLLNVYTHSSTSWSSNEIGSLINALREGEDGKTNWSEIFSKYREQIGHHSLLGNY